MRPDQSRRSHPVLRLLPRWVREHVALSVLAAAAAPVAVWGISRNPLVAPLYLSLAVALVAAEWLDGRLGTRLDRATAAKLVEAITGQPNRTMLVDRDTHDLLHVRRRRLLWSKSWLVSRASDGDRVMDEVWDDFDADRPSTIPIARFLVGGRKVHSLDEVIGVRRGSDGEPEAIPTGHAGALRDLILRVRTGSTQVTPAEVDHLAAQLARAEPIKPEEGREHVTA